MPDQPESAALTIDVPVKEVERTAEESPPDVGRRLVSMDAYRGFVMLLMASEGFGIPQVAKRLPGSRSWQVLHYQFDHVQWVGCGLWDMIQPSFSFLVGVALP